MLVNKVRILLLTLLIFILASCATTLHVNFTRPAQLDLNGAHTIAVLPFKPCEYYRVNNESFTETFFVNSFYQIFDIEDPDEKELLDLLESTIKNGLMKSPYIKLVNSTEVQRAINNGTLNPADVYLTGEMVTFTVKDSKYDEKRLIKEAEGNRKAEYEIVTYWKRTVKYRFRYQVVDSNTNQVISYKEASDTFVEDSCRIKMDLPSAYSMLESDIRALGKAILKQLQPYYVVKTIELLEVKTKDKALKERMKAADKLAGDFKLDEAYAAFTEIYEDYGIMEAGYNAAMLQEAKGNLSLAESLMLEVYERYPVSKVSNGLSDIRYEISQADRLNKQINQSIDDEVIDDIEDSDDLGL